MASELQDSTPGLGGGRYDALCGAVSAALAVTAGAFGAHLLAGRLAPDLLSVWETAVRYQAIHALALLAVAALRIESRWPARLFVLGSALFSGSLYLLALSGWRWLGMITPLGGVAFIAGWVSLAHALRSAR